MTNMNMIVLKIRTTKIGAKKIPYWSPTFEMKQLREREGGREGEREGGREGERGRERVRA